ncbi:MAG: bifunctional methylenetetrahydrofolate dehydrogenase/methenyltetrahydrofolate cyclohydrolase FolD, partial [Proteobacteria bacterium]|nr:bifunctional methylenetetrahydrofolate dehydrogenase/methenyltetrahydrofolate cyclohydrolase FolD [Pseudomonadota bacterium]
ALGLRERIGREVAELQAAEGITPGLAVVLVGDDPASQVYVRMKGKATREAGMESFEYRLPAAATQAEVLARVEALNVDDAVDGVLVQLPLPGQIDETVIIDAIDPEKDVDGLHVVNIGRLVTGRPTLIPCTPSGCMVLLRKHLPDLVGKRAIVVGRSHLVGKPIAQLLLAAHCTVTIAHSRTRDLADECRRADILVAAVGKPEMIRGDWIKPGATVIDVGVNRVAGEGGKTKLVGDVAFDEAVSVAGAITPVPGGVGPMTIASLLRNTLIAACRRRGLADPDI